MAPDISGPGAAGGVPIPPSAPVRPAGPPRALVPVERAGPRSTTGDSPLGRSGVALGDLLLAPDTLETREAVAPVAMEAGLETARRQLLQRLPAEALATLDEVWASAAASEEGWYLRAGALTVAGHPIEGERVATEALAGQPQSLALRLLQSVARAVMGDLSGARAALTPALEHAPEEPVLLAQHAVVLARQGHSDDASNALAILAHRSPDHPAVAWARSAVRAAGIDRARSHARPGVALHDDVDLPSAGEPETAKGPREGTVSAVDDDHAVADGDLVTGAFRRLGWRVTLEQPDALQQAARTLLRACAAGGTMASACTPQEAHAARQLLATLVVVLRGASGRDPLTTPGTPLANLVTQLMPLLRRAGASPAEQLAGLADADRLLRRQAVGITPPVRSLLTALVRGAGDAIGAVSTSDVGSGATPVSVSASSARSGAEDRVETPVVQGLLPDETDLGPLVPVRLGLGLLTETAATRTLERLQEPYDVVPWGSGVPETHGTGWGAARAVAAAGDRPADSSRSPAAALPAILLVAGALGAAVNGAALVAAVMGGAALWVALRRPSSS